jgi:iron complex outermembrane recepter protein
MRNSGIEGSVTAGARIVDWLSSDLSAVSATLLLLTLWSLSPAAEVGPSSAESATASSVTQEVGGLEEVVVTARKRTESAQDAPVSLVVFTPEQLNKYDIESIEQLQSATPQLAVGRTSTGSGAEISIRGIGSNFISVGIEQSVAVIVDGAYYGSGRTLNEGLFDVKQIEVLKGPQALFFGKNATAGVISVTTADPTDKFEANARISEEFESHNVTAQGVISTPITDTLSIRAAFQGSYMFGGLFENHGGVDNYHTTDVVTGITSDNVGSPGDFDTPQERQYLGRVTAKWTPVDNLTATLKVAGDSDRTNNPAWNGVPLCAGPTMALSPGTPCPRTFDVYEVNLPPNIAASGLPGAGNGNLYNHYDSWAVTGTVNYSLPVLDLTSVNNFNYYRNSLLQENSFESPAINPPGGWSTEDGRWQGFSTEDRVLTKFDEPVNGLVGLYYQKTNFRWDQWPVFAGAENSAAPAGLEYAAVQKDSGTHGQTESIYGQMIWKIVPTLELDAGARYIHETKDSYFVQPYATPILNPYVYIPNVPVTADQSFNNWNPEATLTWRPDVNITVYGAYKTGYKSGGFDNSSIYGPHTLPNGLIFQPEKSDGLEAGLKTTTLNNQLLFNLIVYHYRFSNLQIDFYNAQTISYAAVNAGSAKTDGVEIETEWAPIALKGFRVHGFTNYNKARYVSFAGPCWGGQTVPEGCSLVGPGGALFQNLDGKPTADAPLWTASLGLDYETPISANYLIGLSTNGSYETASTASAVQAPLAQQGSYFRLDASLRFVTTDRRWLVQLIGKNLTNQFHFNSVYDITGTGSPTGAPQAHGTPSEEIAFVSNPRTIELQAAWRY